MDVDAAANKSEFIVLPLEAQYPGARVWVPKFS